jgi:AmmeMemoRadiSam system protein A
MIKEYYGAFKVVRIGISGQSLVQHYRLGKIIAQTAKALNRKVVVIASGDMSHKLLSEGPYGFAPEGPVFDEKIQNIVERGNFQELMEISGQFCEEAAECGLRPLVTLAGTLDGRDVDSKVLSYEGPFGVGYLVASFLPLGENSNRHFDVSFEKGERQRLEKEQSKEDAFVHLARRSLETKIKEHREIGLDEVPQELLTEELREKQAGVFVTLKKHGELRGCIGTTFPVQKSIGWEILHNAISAGLEDPRFDSVSLEELPFLEYSVDVLGNAETAATMDDLDPVEYGVIVESGYRKGLLLPNLEGVETPEKQVSIALQKAGIPEGEPYTMKRFKVTRHK